MTVQGLVNSFCDRMGIARPTTLISASVSSPNDRQLHALLIAVCEELRQERCWDQQKKIHSFTTTSGRSKYPFPQDFYAPVFNTQRNTTQNQALYGPVPDGLFEYWLDSGGGVRDFAYRVLGPDFNPNTAGGQVEVYPTPGSTTQTIRYAYYTKNLFMPPNWLPSTAYISNTSRVNSNGYNYLCDTSGTSASTTGPTGTTTNITDGAARWDWIEEPYETILSNSDLCLFDEDLVKLGLRSKWLQDEGEEYEAEEAEYRRKITAASARFKGSFVGSFARKGYRPRYSYPIGGW